MGALSQAMVERLTAQYQLETCNSLRYFQKATFAESIGLSGIAHFFRKEARGERKHADLVFKYANLRNIALPIAPLTFEDPDLSPETNAVDLFAAAWEAEQATTVALEGMLALARQERDFLTEQWLLDPAGLLREQAEEENLYTTILDRIGQMKGSPSLVHDLDIWVGEA